MGLLAKLLGADTASLARSPGPIDDFWYELVGGSASGVRVTPETALTISAFYAGVSIIASTIASLPLPIYRRIPGGKERATNHPLYDVLQDRPNAWQTAMEWREMMTGHVIVRGNAYSLIVPGDRGFVDQLVPLHPGRMTVEQMAGGGLRYRYRRADGRDVVYQQDEIFHLRGLSSDGITGLSVVALGRDSLGLAMAAEQFGARRFSQNASPGGVLEHPGTLGKEANDRMKASWEAAHSGVQNAHRVAILEEGMKWHEVGMSNEDAQFLGTRDFQVREVARWLNMPAHMLKVQSGTEAYASVEIKSLEFVIYTLTPWLVRWEQAISRDLILAPQTYFAEHLVAGLLRGDIRTRYSAYAVGLQNGFLSPNDVRSFENLNPIAGGDTYRVQVNTMPIDAQPDTPDAPADEDSSPGNPQPPARADSRLDMLATEMAGRVVRKEIAAVGKAAKRLADDSDAFRLWLTQFYGGHAAFVAQATRLPVDVAQAYAEGQRDAVLWGGVRVLETWEQDVTPQLARLVKARAGG